MKKEDKIKANKAVVSGIYLNLNAQVSKYKLWSTEALQQEYKHVQSYTSVRYLKQASKVKLEALQAELAKRKSS